jgi:Putative beta barrel porin-7 (BBP7)
MKRGLISTMAVLLAGSTMALAQDAGPAASKPATPLSVQTSQANGSGGGLASSGQAGANGADQPAPPPTRIGAGPDDHVSWSGNGNGHSGLWNGDANGVGGYQFWGTLEYLLWQLENGPLPAATVMIPSTQTTFGSLTTTTTFSETNLRIPDKSGGRITLGYWVDPEQSFGVNASFFELEKRSAELTAGSVTDLQLNFPFTSVTPPTTITTTTGGVTVTQTIPATFTNTTASLPGILIVAANISSSSKLYGADANASCRVCSVFSDRLYLFAGFRYLNLDEDFTLSDNITLNRAAGPVVLSVVPVGGVPAPPTPPPINIPTASLTTTDDITTHNHFYGVSVGFAFDGPHAGPVFLEGWAKISAGAMDQIVEVTGNTFSGPIVTSSGALTSPLSVGRHTRTRMEFVPETNIKLGYRFTPNIRAFVGYDLLFFTSVVRPGAQITTATTTATANIFGQTTTVHTVEPTFGFNGQELLIHGLNFGVELRF